MFEIAQAPAPTPALFSVVITDNGPEVRPFPCHLVGSVGPMTLWEAENMARDYTQFTGILPNGLGGQSNV